jgi:hypothetical protein
MKKNSDNLGATMADLANLNAEVKNITERLDAKDRFEQDYKLIQGNILDDMKDALQQ